MRNVRLAALMIIFNKELLVYNVLDIFRGYSEKKTSFLEESGKSSQELQGFL